MAHGYPSPRRAVLRVPLEHIARSLNLPSDVSIRGVGATIDPMSVTLMLESTKRFEPVPDNAQAPILFLTQIIGEHGDPEIYWPPVEENDDDAQSERQPEG